MRECSLPDNLRPVPQGPERPTPDSVPGTASRTASKPADDTFCQAIVVTTPPIQGLATGCTPTPPPARPEAVTDTRSGGCRFGHPVRWARGVLLGQGAAQRVGPAPAGTVDCPPRLCARHPAGSEPGAACATPAPAPAPPPRTDHVLPGSAERRVGGKAANGGFSVTGKCRHSLFVKVAQKPRPPRG